MDLKMMKYTHKNVFSWHKKFQVSRGVSFGQNRKISEVGKMGKMGKVKKNINN